MDLIFYVSSCNILAELPNPMYFYNINESVYFAKKISQYGNYLSSRIIQR